MRRVVLIASIASLGFGALACSREAPAPEANNPVDSSAPANNHDSSPPSALPAPAPDAGAAPAPPATGALATPEDAVTTFVGGTRSGDVERLWAVMPRAARDALPEVIRRAANASDAELARAGLTRGELATIAPRDFFAKVVKATPNDPARFPAPATELKASYEEPGRTRASVRFKIGAQICQASTLFEDGVWRVEQAGCDNP